MSFDKMPKNVIVFLGVIFLSLIIFSVSSAGLVSSTQECNDNYIGAQEDYPEINQNLCYHFLESNQLECITSYQKKAGLSYNCIWNRYCTRGDLCVGPDLYIENIKVVQVIENPFELIYGKPSMVRVYSNIDPEKDVGRVPIILEVRYCNTDGYCTAVKTFGPELSTFGIEFTKLDKKEGEDSTNFFIGSPPKDFTYDYINITAKIDPENTFNEDNEKNNDQTVILNFLKQDKKFLILPVPIVVNDAGKIYAPPKLVTEETEIFAGFPFTKLYFNKFTRDLRFVERAYPFDPEMIGSADWSYPEYLTNIKGTFNLDSNEPAIYNAGVKKLKDEIYLRTNRYAAEYGAKMVYADNEINFDLVVAYVNENILRKHDEDGWDYYGGEMSISDDDGLRRGKKTYTTLISATQSDNAILAHEMGHMLGLYITPFSAPYLSEELYRKIPRFGGLADNGWCLDQWVGVSCPEKEARININRVKNPSVTGPGNPAPGVPGYKYLEDQDESKPDETFVSGGRIMDIMGSGGDSEHTWMSTHTYYAIKNELLNWKDIYV